VLLSPMHPLQVWEHHQPDVKASHMCLQLLRLFMLPPLQQPSQGKSFFSTHPLTLRDVKVTSTPFVKQSVQQCFPFMPYLQNSFCSHEITCSMSADSAPPSNSWLSNLHSCEQIPDLLFWCFCIPQKLPPHPLQTGSSWVQGGTGNSSHDPR